MPAALFEIIGSSRIMSALHRRPVRSAIDLDDEAKRKTSEVRNVPTNRVLAAKPDAELIAPERRPELCLRARHRLSERACAFERGFERARHTHDVNASRSTEAPRPLSRLRRQLPRGGARPPPSATHSPPPWGRWPRSGRRGMVLAILTSCPSSRGGGRRGRAACRRGNRRASRLERPHPEDQEARLRRRLFGRARRAP